MTALRSIDQYDPLVTDLAILDRITAALGDHLESLSIGQKRRILSLTSLMSIGYSVQTSEQILTQYSTNPVLLPANLYHWLNQLSGDGLLMLTIFLAEQMRTHL
jgi:hypothetical protein